MSVRRVVVPGSTRSGRRVGGMACACLLSMSIGPMTSAEERLRVEGLLDAEYWNTQGDSRLLQRNEDDPAGVGRLRLWAIGEFMPRFQGFVMGDIEGGDATLEGETEVDLEQAFLRYTFATRHLVLDAGKIVTPIGNFPRRYLSSTNPLIGVPAGYSVNYPVGVQISGAAGTFDYRVAVMDRPVVNEAWVPEGDSAIRPAVAAGWTPVVGTRIGAFATRGTYLGEGIDPFLVPGDRWQDFDQTLYGLDAQFSRGYFEFNGEWTRSGYEVPGVGTVRGIAYFVEPKYTFTPRLFAALRYERNDYAFVLPLYPGGWLGTTAKFASCEVGVGYRILPDLIVKAAYRQDHWYEQDHAFFPDGRSVAVQISYAFDVNSWVRRPL